MSYNCPKPNVPKILDTKDESKLDKKEEVRQLLEIYQIKCFSIVYSCDDTEVEENLKDDIKRIKQRILELVSE